MAKKADAKKVETVPVEAKLKALYDLQKIDSEIDRLHTIRGELPLEVQDLEDELEGLKTRVAKLNEDKAALDKEVSGKKIAIDEANSQIAKYKEQQDNVRNNREFESLSKEIEFQELEIQLCEKRIREFSAQIDAKVEVITSTSNKLDERTKDLEAKQAELEEIIQETEKDEKSLQTKSTKAQKDIDERLLTAYHRIRGNSRNGLALVNIQRDSCGGCFSKIPPQRALDIASHKKIIVCESCGRILVDFELETVPTEEEPVKKKGTRTSRAKKTEA